MGSMAAPNVKRTFDGTCMSQKGPAAEVEGAGMPPMFRPSRTSRAGSARSKQPDAKKLRPIAYFSRPDRSRGRSIPGELRDA